MKIKHLNCGSMNSIAPALMRSKDAPKNLPPLLCHCLLIETDEGLVLVDTGFGTADIQQGARRLGVPFVSGVRPHLDLNETALRQIQTLGYQADDVRHIIVTHLDIDHAGGISDFPKAKVHVMASEHAAAETRAHWKERDRYKAAQWAHNPEWALYQASGEDWFGFDCVRQLHGLPPEILLIPLAGHTRGHAGIAVNTGKRWLLHAGDAYFHHHEMSIHGPRCPAALRLFQSLLAIDNDLRLQNQHRLQDLVANHSSEVSVFSAHDPHEWQSLAFAGATE